MMYNTSHTLSFIQLHWLLDQPSAQEFAKYMGQLSPAPALVSALLVSAWKGLMDKLQSAFGDLQLCFKQQAFCYYIFQGLLLHITLYLRALA